MADAKPNTPYIDFGKGQPTKAMTPATKKLVDDGWELKRRVDELNAELKVINKKLIDKHPGVSLVVPGQCRCPIARSTSVKVKESGLDVLKDIFKRKLGDFVKKTITHSPTSELKAIVADSEHELHDEVIDTVDVSHGAYGIKWNTAK